LGAAKSAGNEWVTAGFRFNLFGGLFGGGAAGGAGGFTNTPEGKIVVAAFIDSYNQLRQ
jgi:hypothetical protein